MFRGLVSASEMRWFAGGRSVRKNPEGQRDQTAKKRLSSVLIPQRHIVGIQTLSSWRLITPSCLILPSFFFNSKIPSPCVFLLVDVGHVKHWGLKALNKFRHQRRTGREWTGIVSTRVAEGRTVLLCPAVAWRCVGSHKWAHLKQDCCCSRAKSQAADSDRCHSVTAPPHLPVYAGAFTQGRRFGKICSQFQMSFRQRQKTKQNKTLVNESLWVEVAGFCNHQRPFFFTNKLFPVPG